MKACLVTEHRRLRGDYPDGFTGVITMPQRVDLVAAKGAEYAHASLLRLARDAAGALYQKVGAGWLFLGPDPLAT